VRSNSYCTWYESASEWAARLRRVNSVPDEVDPDWRRLWRLAERLWPGADEDDDYSDGTAAGVFGDIGLFLMSPDRPVTDGGYATSPLGAAFFGGTGVDGVHFSLLPPDGSAVSPVVMTAPTAFDNPNVVVGADLREFLSLGCTVGYYVLQQLVHDADGRPGEGRNATIHRMRCAEPDGTEEEVALLRALTAEFDLRPWPEPADRLAELERTYFHRIQVDPRRV
jgi:hypothetical protein